MRSGLTHLAGFAVALLLAAACATGGNDSSGDGGSPGVDASTDAPTTVEASSSEAGMTDGAPSDASEDAGPCTAGAVECSGDTPQTCVDGGWQPGTLCVFACANGTCTGDCVPGTEQCSGLQPQKCSATGTWQSNGTPCPALCTQGQCEPACTPGTVQCAGLQPQTCSAGSAWQDTGTACPYVCTAGACTGSCVPGSTQCSGLIPQSCDASGAWQSGSACSFVCSAGSCTGVCVPSSTQCASDGVTPQTCSASGTWQNGAACPFTCSQGKCAGACTPNATQACSTSCGTTGTATCGASFAWGSCAPPPEICNLVDDDCNGLCDDVAGCRIGVDRSYDATTGEHFYTTSDTEAACCGFTVETLDYYYLYDAAQPGLVPFYRCVLTSGFHFDTTSSTCEGASATNEGSMGWIATGAVCGSVPLYRLYNAASGDHLYTISAAEVTAAEASGYTLEFTAGYVWTASEG